MCAENNKLIKPGRWFVELDEAGNISNAVYDPSYRELLGYYTEDEFFNAMKNWTDRLHPDDIERVEEYTAEVMAPHPEGMDYDIEYRMITKNGYHMFHDYGYCTRREDGSLARCDGVVFDIQDTVDKNEAHRVLMENYMRVLALEDDFESFYDVELDTGKYELLIKGETYDKEIKDRLLEINEYFSDLQKNIDVVIYPDDREGLRRIMTREAIREGLARNASIDHYYRVMVQDEPIWFKVRVVYKDEKKKNVIIGVFNAQAEMTAKQHEQKMRDELIKSIVSECSLAYKVNLNNDSFEVLRADSNIYGSDGDYATFSEALDFFKEKVLHPADKVRVAYELDYEVIRQRLVEEHTYNIEYRALINNATIWHEMSITAIGSGEVAIGFAVKNLEIVKNHLEDKKYNEAFALFVADFDTEMIQSVKKTPLFSTAEIGQAVPYKLAIQQFANVCEGETREFFNQLSDINYIRRELMTDDKRTYSYKSFMGGDGEGKWIDVEIYVIERHEDGVPSMFTLGFSLVDSLAIARQELNARLKEDMQMIGGLASGYTNLYYLNIETETFRVYAVNGEKLSETERFAGASGEAFEAIHRYAESDLIHPDDRYLFRELNADVIRERLAHRKRFSLRFRRNFNGEYHWAEMEVIKYEDVNEPASIVAVGFTDRDNEIRTEQAMSTCFDVIGRDYPPEKSINKLLSTVGEYYGAERCYIFEYSKNNELISNTYEWCAEGISPMISELQSVPSTEIVGWIKEFEEHGAFYMDALDTEGAYGSEDGRKLLEMQGIDSLIAAPIVSGEDIKGFIGIDNPSRAKKNISILKNFSVIVYSEILKRKENDEEHITLEKLADTFVSVYFVDLSTDYMRTWKIADEYKDAYGETVNYSVSMGDYVHNRIAEDERERCIAMSSPEYILEQFRNEDTFSVSMTDIMLGYERNFVFDYIKVNDDGTQFVMCCSDVTDSLEKEREQALMMDLANQQRHIKAFGDMVNAALWSMDVNGESEVQGVFWSQELRHMFGFENEEDFPNTIEAWTTRIHPDDFEQTAKEFSAGIGNGATEENIFNIRYRVKRKSGEYCWYQSVGRMEDNEDGTRRLYGIVFDISSEKKLEEQAIQLQKARDDADTANQSKTTFLFNMSHDIRTPMNAITGFTSMAKKYVDDSERVSDYLDKIDTSGQQLLKLVNQVLEMARIESGKIELEEKPIKVNESYNAMVTVLTEQAKANGLEFHHSMSDVVHNDILADEARMSSITLNITGNAMKYTPRGGRIDFLFREIPGRKEGYASFVLTVSDTGIGMSPEYLKVLFDPFTRENNTTVSKIQGTGLGMSIVKDLVDLLGGNIEVQSELGKGTRFDITIDFKINEETKAETDNAQTVDFNLLRGHKVLLVEDNELNREIAVDMLEEEGLLVEDADDGTVAVEMLREKGPKYYDFILMDIQMPIMGGYEASRAIRGMYPDDHIPIIALSANAFAEDKTASIKAGMDDHVAKPIDMNELFTAMARFI